MNLDETVDVVQTVVKFQTEKGEEKYLLGLRTKDGFWEFFGGKLEDGEKVKQAAIRELNEETDLELSEKNFLDYREGKTYRSSKDEKYQLNPVLIEIEESKASEMSEKGLNREHKNFKWIDLLDFYNYETLGQYQALENLGISNGDVALAVARKNSEYLILKRSEKTSSSGLWNFPGGRIEKSDAPNSISEGNADDKVEEEGIKEATLRELEEETDLEGEIVERGEPYISSGELGYWRVYPFLVEVEGDVSLNSEHSDFNWIQTGQLENLETLGTSQAVENLGLAK